MSAKGRGCLLGPSTSSSNIVSAVVWKQPLHIGAYADSTGAGVSNGRIVGVRYCCKNEVWEVGHLEESDPLLQHNLCTSNHQELVDILAGSGEWKPMANGLRKRIVRYAK